MPYADPNAVVNAIKANGTTWSGNRLKISGTDNWPQLSNNDWGLVTSQACSISKAVFNLLRTCTVLSDNRVQTSAGVFKLDKVNENGADWCKLVDP